MKMYSVSSGKKDTPNTRYMYKNTEEGRVYLVPGCVISGHRNSRFVKI